MLPTGQFHILRGVPRASTHAKGTGQNTEGHRRRTDDHTRQPQSLRCVRQPSHHLYHQHAHTPHSVLRPQSSLALPASLLSASSSRPCASSPTTIPIRAGYQHQCVSMHTSGVQQQQQQHVHQSDELAARSHFPSPRHEKKEEDAVKPRSTHERRGFICITYMY